MNYWLTRIPYLIRQKMLFTVIASHFRHAEKRSVSKLLPSVPVSEITDGVSALLMNDKFEDGNLSGDEIACICGIVRKYNPSRIFEIGTFNGRTSLNMAANTGPEARIFTLDLPREHISMTRLRIKKGERKFIHKECSGSHFRGTLHEQKIVQLYGDSAKFDYTMFMNSMDLVFIDGSHSYEYVLNDSEIALKLLRNGKGIILWHDYGWNEVVKALNDYYEKDSRFTGLKQITGTSFAFIRFL